ncbi:MAG: hypothetical protein N2447_06175 [Thermoanaerobaculum sp.]|nr:hypothetical protein [Thermoanaerobaculum sp.]
MIPLLAVASLVQASATVPLLNTAEAWWPVAAEGVQVELTSTPPCPLLVRYNFHQVAGWAGAATALDLAAPPGFAVLLRVSGKGTPNTLEVKLKDGENVFWHVRPAFLPRQPAQELWIPHQLITFAWGPQAAERPARISGVEVVLSAQSGGEGELCLEALELQTFSTPVKLALTNLQASSSAAPHPPSLARDGNPATFWQGKEGELATLSWELVPQRPLAGLVLHWGPTPPRHLRVRVQHQGEWGWLADQAPPPGPLAAIPFGEVGTIQACAVELQPPPGGAVAVAEVELAEAIPSGELTWAWEQWARATPRGTFPRALSSQQVYWTVTALPEGELKLVVSEDGAVELDPRGITLEPMVQVGERLFTWADMEISQHLEQNSLPLPEVRWRGLDWQLRWAARVARWAGWEVVLLRGCLENPTGSPIRGKLWVLLRPFRVPPPWASLNLPAPVAPMVRLEANSTLQVNGQWQVVGYPPTSWRCVPFTWGEVGVWLRAGLSPPSQRVEDPHGGASAAAAWPFDLPPGEKRCWQLVVAPPAVAKPAEEVLAHWSQLWAQAQREWERALPTFELALPGWPGSPVELVRANLAFILAHRHGAALQPGSRQYARQWIRDAHGIGLVLLRFGLFHPVRQFLHHFARFQFADGRIPCCVDRRGADPVPEHDSHGQFLVLLGAYTAYAGEVATASALWPQVERTVDALFRLRGQRLGAPFQAGDAQHFFGLLPPSISHEGYSAFPVHSYWDNLWALAGLREAAWLAHRLGHFPQAEVWTQQGESWARDLLTSMERVRRHHQLPFVPASADLGDEDPTSLAVAWNLNLKAVTGASLPWRETFQRALEHRRRRHREAPWVEYTPYEARVAGALVRLGWREEAWELLRVIAQDRRPPGWQGWPEVITRDPRLPKFVGDMPHGWIAAEFLNALLDTLAYPEGDSLRVAAGIPERFLAPGQRLAVGPLATPWGWCSLHAEGTPTRYVFSLAGTTPPAGVWLDWPWGGEARVNGHVVQRTAAGIHLTQLPAQVVISRLKGR